MPNRLVTTLTGDAGTVAGIATGVAVLTGWPTVVAAGAAGADTRVHAAAGARLTVAGDAG